MEHIEIEKVTCAQALRCTMTPFFADCYTMSLVIFMICHGHALRTQQDGQDIQR